MDVCLQPCAGWSAVAHVLRHPRSIKVAAQITLAGITQQRQDRALLATLRISQASVSMPTKLVPVDGPTLRPNRPDSTCMAATESTF